MWKSKEKALLRQGRANANPWGESQSVWGRTRSLMWLEYSEQRRENDKRSQKKRYGPDFVRL